MDTSAYLNSGGHGRVQGLPMDAVSSAGLLRAAPTRYQRTNIPWPLCPHYAHPCLFFASAFNCAALRLCRLF